MLYARARARAVYYFFVTECYFTTRFSVFTFAYRSITAPTHSNRTQIPRTNATCWIDGIGPCARITDAKNLYICMSAWLADVSLPFLVVVGVCGPTVSPSADSQNDAYKISEQIFLHVYLKSCCKIEQMCALRSISSIFISNINKKFTKTIEKIKK